MTEADKTALIERCKGFSEEEYKIVANCMPNDVLVTELARRLSTLELVKDYVVSLSVTASEEIIYGK